MKISKSYLELDSQNGPKYEPILYLIRNCESILYYFCHFFQSIKKALFTLSTKKIESPFLSDNHNKKMLTI